MRNTQYVSIRAVCVAKRRHTFSKLRILRSKMEIYITGKEVSLLRKHKVILWYLVICMTMLCLCACKKREEHSGDDLLTPPPVTTPDKPDSLGIDFQPQKLKTISYYTISDAMEKQEAVGMFSEDVLLTPETLVIFVAKSMADADLTVEVDSVTTNGKRVIISFQETSMPVVDTDKNLECEILDAIAMSILENLTEYSERQKLLTSIETLTLIMSIWQINTIPVF